MLLEETPRCWSKGVPSRVREGGNGGDSADWPVRSSLPGTAAARRVLTSPVSLSHQLLTAAPGRELRWLCWECLQKQGWEEEDVSLRGNRLRGMNSKENVSPETLFKKKVLFSGRRVFCPDYNRDFQADFVREGGSLLSSLSKREVSGCC